MEWIQNTASTKCGFWVSTWPTLLTWVSSNENDSRLKTSHTWIELLSFIVFFEYFFGLELVRDNWMKILLFLLDFFKNTTRIHNYPSFFSAAAGIIKIMTLSLDHWCHKSSHMDSVDSLKEVGGQVKSQLTTKTSTKITSRMFRKVNFMAMSVWEPTETESIRLANKKQDFTDNLTRLAFSVKLS